MSEHAATSGSAGESQKEPTGAEGVQPGKSLRERLISFGREWLIGLGIVVAVVFVQDRGFLKTNTDDVSADELMRFHVGVVDENKHAYPFALIAIDEQTYRDWKEPLITPRDKLAKIIKFAVDGKAALIFLDIELSRLGDGTPVSGDEPARTCDQLKPLKKADAELCDRMVGQPGKCDQIRQLRNADAELCEVVKQTGSIPIILARTIAAASDSRPGEERWDVRASFLDPILGDVPNPSMHWASPLYSLDSDRFIRRSRLWELVCENSELKEKGKLKAVPSVELLALALIDQKADALQKTMASIPQGDCINRRTDVDLLDPFKLRSSDGRIIEIDLTPESPRDRILYSIEWAGEQSRLYADEPGREPRPQVTNPKTNQKTDVVTTISAGTITDGADLDPKVLEGHIVVIGATHREAGDLHETPLGLMPGSLIIINAIHSLRQYEQLSEPPVWQKGILAAVVMTICVLAYHVFWAELVSIVFPPLSFVLAFCLNILFVHEGIWIDAALPTFIYSIFNFLYAQVIELKVRAAAERSRDPKIKWSACLRALLNERTFDHDKHRGERWRDQSDVRDTTRH